MPITDKIFSKLKVVGTTLSPTNPNATEKTLLKCLPDSYGTILATLCGLTPQELLFTAQEQRHHQEDQHPDARDYVKRIGYPVHRVEQQKPRHDLEDHPHH